MTNTMEIMMMVMIMSTIRTYSELIKLPTFEERYNYLKIGNEIGFETFGSERYLNQMLYTSKEWRKVRDEVIVRDDGCDLGVAGEYIEGIIIVHHMNPITVDDIVNRSPLVFDPEYLISSRGTTHRGIHFDASTEIPKPYAFKERREYDTCPWRVRKGDRYD